VGREEGELVLSSRWRVAGPREQAAVVRATQAVWSRRALPEGLGSYALFMGHDGRTLLHHSTWANEAAYATYARYIRGERLAAIEAAPGVGVIERLGMHKLRRFRSVDHRGAGSARVVPGCLVAVDVALASPRAKDWVDTVVSAVHAEGGLPDGALAAHLHVSDDRRSAFHFTEWTSAAAHQRALESHGGRLGGSRAWESVRAFPGVTFSYGHYDLGFSARASRPSSPTWWRWA